MKTTREEILHISLRLFAEKGFDGVSTSMIAAELGITKGALYRHFDSKQGIFDAIVEHMFSLDAQQASEADVPEKTYEEDAKAYGETSFHDLCTFAAGQLSFWTENPFARDFRRMLELEQYKSKARMELYQNVIVSGPVIYSKDIIEELIQQGKLTNEAEELGPFVLAVQLYAPLSLMIHLYDGGMELQILKEQLAGIMEDFEKRWTYERD